MLKASEVDPMDNGGLPSLVLQAFAQVLPNLLSFDAAWDRFSFIVVTKTG
jgi:hypothetical protein